MIRMKSIRRFSLVGQGYGKPRQLPMRAPRPHFVARGELRGPRTAPLSGAGGLDAHRFLAFFMALNSSISQPNPVPPAAGLCTEGV